MSNRATKPAWRVLSYLLVLTLLVTLSAAAFSVRATEGPTSLGLAEHGLMAYEDGWKYQYGGKGEEIGDGVRVSDCAGLIYSYYKDIGALGNCMASVNAQIQYNCVFSGDIDELDGVPRIHGLVVTFPDYYSPETGIYSHIGIYIGNNLAVDNSDYGVDMVLSEVEGSNRGWTAWHVFDNGTLYPSNGWYEFDGKLYHYADCQYQVDTVVDGFTIGSDGVALDAAGNPLEAGAEGAPALSSEYVSATAVAQQLKSLGYSGSDSTKDLVSGGGDVPEEDSLNGKITGNGVRLRQEPNTTSGIVATLSRGERVEILESVTGQTITDGLSISDQWYSVVTSTGRSGYVCALYVERVAVLTAPTFSLDESGGLAITAGEGCDIRYTEDGSHPTETSTPYTGPLYISGTYAAVAVKGESISPMATITYAGGSLFTDFTSEAWYFSHVDKAVSLGLFSGSGTSFNPDKQITRAEFVAAMANLAGVDTSPYKGETSFTDVSATDWYSGAVNWAVSQGVMSGMGNGQFRPNDSITREQICVAIANYSGISASGSSQPFADDETISSWAKNAVYACRDMGLISGVGDNLFAPQNNASRSQACVIVLNAYDAGL